MDDTRFDDAHEDVLDIGARTWRRPVRVAVALVAIAAVVAVAALTWHHSRGRAKPVARPPALALSTTSAGRVAASPAPPTTSVPTVPYPSALPVAVTSNGEATNRLLTQLLADMPIVPGAVAQASGPMPGQAETNDGDNPGLVVTENGTPVVVSGGSDDDPYSDDLIRLAWWTAPGTVAAAIAYYVAHAPKPLSWEDNDYADGVPVPTTHEVTFGAPDTAYATTIEVVVNVVTEGDGVAVEVLARAVSITQVTPYEAIVAPTSVVITIERAGRPTVHRTLGAKVAGQLAHIANGLTLFTPMAVGCPFYAGALDTIRFITPDGPITVITDPSGCQAIQIETEIEGETQPTLMNGSTLVHGPTLDATALKAVGLPANYGRAGG